MGSASIRNTNQRPTLTVRARVEIRSTRATATVTMKITTVAVIMTAATAAVPTLRNHTVNSASAKIQTTKNPPATLSAKTTLSAARRSTKATASATIATTIVAVGTT